MRFLYTGADKFNVSQTDPSKSLGGFISSSIIPNDYLGNIFSEADKRSIDEKRIEVRCIAIHNNTASAITSNTLEIVLDDDSICNYRIGFQAVGEDDCDNKYFEQVINSQALPYEVTFSPIVSEEVISLPDIAADSYLGMWLIREFKEEEDIADNPDTSVPIKNCAYFEKVFADSQVDGFVPVVIKKEEQIEFDFSFT